MKKLVQVLFCILSVTTGITQAAEKKLNVQHFFQDDGCWCGVATSEMVEQFYRGNSWKYYTARQKNLANPKHNGGVRVGTIAEGKKTGVKPCGPAGGLDTNEMPKMLNTRLNEHNKHFQYLWTSVSGSPLKSNYLHTRIMQSINKNDPYIFSGHTRYNDGTKKHRQHWYLIIGYKDADGNPNTMSDTDGYYIHDAAFGARLGGVKTLGKKGKFVSHFNMVKYLAEYQSKVLSLVQVK